MRLTWLLCLLPAVAWAGSSDKGAKKASLSTALEHLTANQTSTANWENISSPPRTLIPEMLSAVPVTVLWELVIPTQRSSLADQFNSGHTPDWYKSLPANVKSYFSEVKSQVDAGLLTATPTSNTAATPTATASATPSSSPSGSPTPSASQGLAPARPTGGALTASVAGAIGVLGVVLAL